MSPLFRKDYLHRVSRWYHFRNLLNFHKSHLKEGLELGVLKNAAITGTGEDSKLVHRRKRPEVDSAPSRKYSRPLLDVFACIG